ncbi:MAG: transcription termination/antitermination factor NusG [Chitinivibrionales bacterium]|nr:transcription termination/antitermination factor NusG [Chitinivibrionales bacterium]
MGFNWYVIQTYTGQESKVVQRIQEFIDSGDLQGLITRVMSPTHDVIQIKNGKKVRTSRKFFPSYVLVEMELCKEALHFVQNIGGVTGFIGGRNPQPLREDEVKRILGQSEKLERQQVSEVPFEVGDAVKIKEGPFKDFDGVVEEVHPEKGKIKVMVSVFGRSTPVEVDFVHVTPLS